MINLAMHATDTVRIRLPHPISISQASGARDQHLEPAAVCRWLRSLGAALHEVVNAAQADPEKRLHMFASFRQLQLPHKASYCLRSCDNCPPKQIIVFAEIFVVHEKLQLI